MAMGKGGGWGGPSTGDGVIVDSILSNHKWPSRLTRNKGKKLTSPPTARVFPSGETASEETV